MNFPSQANACCSHYINTRLSRDRAHTQVLCPSLSEVFTRNENPSHASLCTPECASSLMSPILLQPMETCPVRSDRSPCPGFQLGLLLLFQLCQAVSRCWATPTSPTRKSRSGVPGFRPSPLPMLLAHPRKGVSAISVASRKTQTQSSQSGCTCVTTEQSGYRLTRHVLCLLRPGSPEEHIQYGITPARVVSGQCPLRTEWRSRSVRSAAVVTTMEV